MFKNKHKIQKRQMVKTADWGKTGTHKENLTTSAH